MMFGSNEAAARRWKQGLLWLAVAVACMISLPSPAQEHGSTAMLEATKLNNIGVAYMNQQLPGRAIERFRAAEQVQPRAFEPKLNEAIGLFYTGKAKEAEEAFRAAQVLKPESARPTYCLGLLHMQSGDFTKAESEFASAETIDPHDADVHYFLGAAELSLRKYVEAEREYKAALQINPLHASAEYGLAQTLRHAGSTADARPHLVRFQQLTDDKNGTTISSQYSQQGALALVQEMPLAQPAVQPMIPVKYLMRQMDSPPASSPSTHHAGLCLIDMEDSGAKTILQVSNGAHALRAFRMSEHKLTEMSLQETGLAVSGDGIACAVGDFDNDGLPDIAVAFSDHVALFRNVGHGHFEDVTEKVGIRSANQPSGLTFVDFDHDGDLDLFLTGSPMKSGGSANVLWRNNGNGTFTQWTEQTALRGDGKTAATAITDINNDRAIDFVVTGEHSAPAVYLNQREGAFQQVPLFTAPSLPPSRGVAIADFNKDGWMDVVLTHAGAPGITLWSNVRGNSFTQLPISIKGAKAAWGVTTFDFDNDGWIDIAALVETPSGTRLKVFRNTGSGSFQDVSAILGLDALSFDGARSLIAADLSNRGVTDLVVGVPGRSPIVLENQGAERNHVLRLHLSGLADNKSAIGTKVEVFAGGLWQKFEVPGSSGYASQGDLDVNAGIGSQTTVDIVRLLWPTGVPQDELNVESNKVFQVKELDRRGSSCPVLFASDGKSFHFVSDIIGAAVIGHWISPSAHNANDSDEWAKVDGALLKPSNGLLQLRFGEPMEEINYIDQVRLVAVDHPDGTNVYPDERFLTNPPFASGALVVASASTHAVAGAWDSSGRDVRSELAKPDHVYVRDFHNLSYAGFAEPHTLTLDLGSWNPELPLKLLLHGYIEYFSASSMYGAWQASLAPEPPSIEANMPDGSWKRVVDDMGFPAGLPRTIVVDLTGKLPAGTRRIRLRTNLQIYWDQILVDNGQPASGTIQTEVPLHSARLVFRGYPKQIENQTPGDLTYDYNTISATGPFFWQRGAYTRFGEVKPLLGARDDHYVIFGSGEEIDTDFDATALPPVPPHWKRDYLFYADGFVKDMDFYEAMPYAVSELPFHAMRTYPYGDPAAYFESTDAVDYELEWNNRFESGTRLQHFDFDYKPSSADAAIGGTR